MTAPLPLIGLAPNPASLLRIAQSHGLTIVNGKIPLPDLRIEYETRDRQQARVDSEVATEDYREQESPKGQRLASRSMPQETKPLACAPPFETPNSHEEF